MASTGEQQQRHVTETETRLVIVGRTGEGKSATGNSIVGRKEFASKKTAGSVTTKCKMFRGDIQGKLVLLIDTPGLFDTQEDTTNETTLLEIAKCLTISSPGPHAFILTMSSNRFTKELQQTIQLLRETFSEDVLKHTIVIITGKDQLEEEETTLDEFLEGAPNFIKDILKACDNRCIAFNNRLSKDADKNDAQVAALLQMVDRLVEKSDIFSSTVYEDIEQKLLQEEARREERIDEEYKPIMDNYNKQIQETVEKMEESRLKAEEEAEKARMEEEDQRKLAEETKRLDANRRKAQAKENERLKKEKEEEEIKAKHEQERLQKKKERLENERARKKKELEDKKRKVRDDIRDVALGGATCGGAAGAAVGSFAPGVGTVFGGGVGAIIGAITGFLAALVGEEETSE